MNCRTPHARTLRILLIALALLLANHPAAAHMMVAQHGTLNLVGDGAFLVVSLPVSAFDGIDDNADGRLSASEFKLHRMSIIERVTQGLVLSDGDEACPLQGIMLSLAEDHDDPGKPSLQLIVMGRFALQNAPNNLRLTVDLFGTGHAEKQLKFSARQRSREQHDSFELSPDKPEHQLFPGP